MARRTVLTALAVLALAPGRAGAASAGMTGHVAATAGWHDRVAVVVDDQRHRGAFSSLQSTPSAYSASTHETVLLGRLSAPGDRNVIGRAVAAGRDGYAVAAEAVDGCYSEEGTCERGWQVATGAWDQPPVARLSCYQGAPVPSLAAGDGFVVIGSRGCGWDGVYVISGDQAPARVADDGEALAAAGRYAVYSADRRDLRLRDVTSGDEATIPLERSLSDEGEVLVTEDGRVIVADRGSLVVARRDAPAPVRVAAIGGAAESFASDGVVVWHREAFEVVRTDLATGRSGRFGQLGAQLFPVSVTAAGTPISMSYGCATRRWSLVATTPPSARGRAVGCPVQLGPGAVTVTPAAHPTFSRGAVLELGLRCPGGCDGWVTLDPAGGAAKRDWSRVSSDELALVDVRLAPTGSRLARVRAPVDVPTLRFLRRHPRFTVVAHAHFWPKTARKVLGLRLVR